MSKRLKSENGTKASTTKVVVADDSEAEKIGNKVKKVEGNTIWRHFYTVQDLRKWLDENHLTKSELYICFYTKASGKYSITYEMVLDEMLSYGWIDGVRRSMDKESYCNRYTPRRPTSNWSFVNINKVENLIKEGRMKPAGLEAYSKRKVANAKEAYEKENKKITGVYLTKFKKSKDAYKYFTEQTTEYYQKVVSRYIMGAVREETKMQRLDALIEASENGERWDRFKSPNEIKSKSKTTTKSTTTTKKTTVTKKRKDYSSEEEEDESEYESDDESDYSDSDSD